MVHREGVRKVAGPADPGIGRLQPGDPQIDAGPHIEPPVSVSTAPATKPAATAPDAAQ
jgi:hypothetical protein